MGMCNSPDDAHAPTCTRINAEQTCEITHNLRIHTRTRGHTHIPLTHAHAQHEGPPFDVDGYPIWHSGQFELGWMIYNRLLSSPRRAKTPTDADLFFIPAWSRNDLPCADSDELWAALKAENPALCVTPRHFRDHLSFLFFILHAGFDELSLTL
jgi:hypothetical protein